ncbi:MAG TPA: cation:dicarboxylase symporter family transporter [Rhizobiales bacterium]|nr:cation:dicarboxylase symporter family transporter [Hyphomicrobiales bacterium]
MLEKFHDFPLLILVVLSACLAVALHFLGAGFLAEPIQFGSTSLGKSIAALAKDALFVPLKPIMYALIIMSIGSSLAISHGGMGAKFIRVLSFMALFSVIGAAIAIVGYTVFSFLPILPDPASVTTGHEVAIRKITFPEKMYGVLTSPLMISIYAGILFGKALKARGLGEKADEISDLFMKGFRRFLQYTIPLAVFGSITLALSKPGGVETLGNLAPLLIVYLSTFLVVEIIMIAVTTIVLRQPLGVILRAVFPQAIVALSTSSSVATLPASKIACDDMGANGDESTPFITIGATINMVGTLMGLTILSLYAMHSYGLDVSLADKVVVALQSLIYSVSAAGVPSASVVLLQDILTSQGVSAEYATIVTGLIITIDTLALDRLRTMLNTQSDSMSTVMGLHTYYKRPKVLAED